MKLSEYFDSLSGDRNLARALEYSFRFSINLHSNPKVWPIYNDSPVIYVPVHSDDTRWSPTMDEIALDVKTYKYGYSDGKNYIWYTVKAAYHAARDEIFITVDKRVEPAK